MGSGTIQSKVEAVQEMALGRGVCIRFDKGEVSRVV